MMACTTFGPIKLEARFESPNRPKNYRERRFPIKRPRVRVDTGCQTHHIVEARRGQLRHHRLRERVVRSLEESGDDVVCPELPDVVEPAHSVSVIVAQQAD